MKWVYDGKWKEGGWGEYMEGWIFGVYWRRGLEEGARPVGPHGVAGCVHRELRWTGPAAWVSRTSRILADLPQARAARHGLRVYPFCSCFG